MIKIIRLTGLALLLGFCGPALAAGNLYCCIDATGKQVCGDLLPQACYGRAYRELGESGRTTRMVEAPLTAEQRAQRAAEEAQLKAEEAALREKQRKDQALLNTYGSEKDIEVMRVRAQDDVKKSIRAAEAKIVEIRIQRKIFENESEFYTKKQLPPEVQKGLRDADYEIKAQELVIESKKQDLEAIRLKYDEDRRRYLDIARRAALPR
ncbi:hypothetical protein [Propionivibrio sp.]|uniref:hypothetical protein n=1 Tax=Propionivibrio sp. TaxID=2212460 RepID=UPI0026107B91|nr:hypothetical protein [Propionivibrio sp.]